MLIKDNFLALFIELFTFIECHSGKNNGWLGNDWLHGLKYKRALYREMGFSALYIHNVSDHLFEQGMLSVNMTI